MDRRTDRDRILRGLAELALVFVAYSALTIWASWPLFADPSRTLLEPDHPWLANWMGPTLVRAIARDIDLLVWLFAWDWHVLTTNPANLFAANIFHPTPEALSYSEHGLGHLPITGIVQGFSGNPVLAHQTNLFLTFPLSGSSMYLLLRHWHVRAFSAFLGGLVYSICPVRLDMIYHSHLLAGQYFALSLLFLDRTLARGRALDGAVFAIVLCLGLLSSYYVAYMTSVGLLVAGVALLFSLRDRVTQRGIIVAAIATMVPYALVALLSRPYLRIKDSGALTNYADFAPLLSLLSNDAWRNFSFPPALLANGALKLAHGGHAYLGLLPLLLVLTALWPMTDSPGSTGRRARRVGVAVVVVSYLLTLGPVATIAGQAFTLPYGWAMQLIPGFSSTRVPSRFALLLIAGWAVLVGLGSDRAERALSRRRCPRVASLAVLALTLACVIFEYDLHGRGFAARQTPPERDLGAYRRLATLPSGPLLELPFDGTEPEGAGAYMVRSTMHWQPLLNGSSGYAPWSLPIVRALADRLPDVDAQRLLVRMTGVRYVLVHTASMSPLQIQRWRDAQDVEVLESFGPDLLLRLMNTPDNDLVPDLAECSRRRDACDDLWRMVKG